MGGSLERQAPETITRDKKPQKNQNLSVPVRLTKTVATSLEVQAATELVIKAKTGDRRAYGELVRRYFSAIEDADPPYPGTYYVLPHSQTSD